MIPGQQRHRALGRCSRGPPCPSTAALGRLGFGGLPASPVRQVLLHLGPLPLQAQCSERAAPPGSVDYVLTATALTLPSSKARTSQAPVRGP